MSRLSEEKQFEQGIAFLAANGLNLHAVLDCAALPDDIKTPISETLDLIQYSRLVITGNSGQRFWQALQAAGPASIDPIDTFSRNITIELFQKHLQEYRYELVFPAAHSIPLQRIGALIGWGQPSPLGIAINERNGLWFAYRSAFVTDAELPLTERGVGLHPCDQCLDKPCVSGCPGSAVSENKAFDINACFNHRVTDNSPCISTCPARLACPVAPELRYPEGMIDYIYTTSMETVRRYTKT